MTVPGVEILEFVLGDLQPCLFLLEFDLMDDGFLSGLVRLHCKDHRHRQTGQHRNAHRQDRQDRHPIAMNHFSQPVCRARRPRLHRFIGEIAFDIPGQPVGGFIAPGPVLVECFHHDPVEFALDPFSERVHIDLAATGHILAALPH